MGKWTVVITDHGESKSDQMDFQEVHKLGKFIGVIICTISNKTKVHTGEMGCDCQLSCSY